MQIARAAQASMGFADVYADWFTEGTQSDAVTASARDEPPVSPPDDVRVAVATILRP